MLAVQAVGTSGNVLPPGFLEDRAQMIEGGIDLERLLREMPARRDQLRTKLTLVERHLGRGRRFLLGERPSLADLEVYHPLFALRSIPATAPLLGPFANIRAWLERLDAVGHGTRTDISSADALEIARRATPATERRLDADDPNGRKPGDRVAVVHDAFGRDPVLGELVASSADEIAIRRHDERAGEVVVHFPREHYLVLPASDADGYAAPASPSSEARRGS